MTEYRPTKLSGPGRKSILRRFLSFVLPFIVLSITITSAGLSWINYVYFRDTIREDYKNIIRSSAGEIRLYMENARRDLEGLALTVGATKLDPWQEEMALASFNHKTFGSISISLVSTSGEEITSLGERRPAFDHLQDETFLKAVAGETAISPVLLSSENIPYVYIAAPVLHLGKVQKVVWGELNLKSVWNVLEGISIGETGQVYLLDNAGKPIGHREIGLVINRVSLVEGAVLAKLREAGREAPFEWTCDENGRKLYCMGFTIRGLNWVIVLNQDQREIYAYLYRGIVLSLAATLLLSVAAILIGWRRIRDFLTPVRELHRQIQSFGEGDLELRVAVESRDEIGDLGRAFNKMADSLQEFLRREIETAKELAHAKNLAVLGTASSKVTHEVGNLLNNIGLCVRSLKIEPLSEMGSRVIGILEKDSVRVREFIQNFLQFAKKPELQLLRVSLKATFQDVFFVHQAEAAGKGIRLELDWPADLPAVQADTRLLYQVMNNLVKNGIEAMTQPGRIGLSGAVNGDALEIRLEDDGPGIAPETLEKIFDPFFTTKGKKGTGLGLPICKTVMEAHRGSIQCLSEPGKGTTFILRLPLL